MGYLCKRYTIVPLSFVVFVSVLNFSVISAQTPDTLWTRRYGGSELDIGACVQQTSDGGYIIVGDTESFSAIRQDIYLIKTDSNGDTLWTRIIGGGENDGASYVVETPDSGYLIVGGTRSYTSSIDVYIVRTDKYGDTLWTKAVGKINENDAASSIQPTQDGGYIIAGYTRSSQGGSQHDVYLIKLNSIGDTLWTKEIGTVSYGEFGHFCQQTSDGGFIITGYAEDMSNSDVYLAKTDSAGNLVWSKHIDKGDNDVGNYVQETYDGCYIIFARIFTPNGTWAIKTDANGDTLWTRTCPGGRPSSGLQTSDSCYVFAGSNSDVYLMKINDQRDSLWALTLGGSAYDGARCVQQTSDGGYILTGNTASFGSSHDVYLVKMNPIRLISPNGGEDWESGSIHDVVWWMDMMLGNSFRLLLSTDGGTSYIDTIAQNIDPDSVIWSWTLPNIDYCPTCRVKIQIVSQFVGVLAEDESNNDFTIREMDPPIAFSLLLPVDSSYTGNPRPTFIWESSFDSLSGLKNYEVYINNVRRHAGYDTTWTADFDLAEGFNEWYVVAVDSANNRRNSDETWTVFVDTSGPLIDSTTVWPDTSFGGPFAINTKIFELSAVDTAIIYYHRMEDSTWLFTGLTEGSNDWYNGEIPEVNLPDDTVKYYIYATDIVQNRSTDPPNAPTEYYWFIANATGITESGLLPDVFAFNIVNNPARYSAKFQIAIPNDGTLTLIIYDALGRRVGKPFLGSISRGYYKGMWIPPATGVYFYRLESSWTERTGKFIILK